MHLHQFHLSYDEAQDRLLLRVGTTDKVEFRFWLTRRLVKVLWPALVQLMESSEALRRYAAPATKRAALEFERERLLHAADFNQPYSNAEMTPGLPGDPMLVARVGMRAEGAEYRVNLMPATGRGANLRLNDALLHALAKLLQDVVPKAGWEIKLDFPSVPDVTATGRPN